MTSRLYDACPTCGRLWSSRRIEVRHELDYSTGDKRVARDTSVACYVGHRFAIDPWAEDSVTAQLGRGGFPILLPATLRDDG